MLTEYSLETIGKIQKIVDQENSFGHIVTWDGKPSIFYKYDYYTAVFENLSLPDLFHLIGMDNFLPENAFEYFNSMRPTLLSGSPVVFFNLHGVSINLPYFEFVDRMEKIELEDMKSNSICIEAFKTVTFPNIRLTLSGTGLDFLRSQGIAIDDIIDNGYSLKDNQSYHVTRLDVAFDLIDYKGNFYDDLLAACTENMVGYTVPVKDGKGVVFSGNVGANKTIYLGSPSSDRMLRVYDKRWQLDRSGQWLEKCPYRKNNMLPETWIRIELQMRTKQVAGFLASKLDPKSTLKYIYDKYAIRKTEKRFDCGRARFGDVVDTWNELFNFDEITYLLEKSEPNENFVQFETRIEKSDVAVWKMLKHLVLSAGVHGPKETFRIVNSLIIMLAMAPKSSSLGRKYHQLKEWILDNNSILPEYIIFNDDGVPQLVDHLNDDVMLVYGNYHDGINTEDYYINKKTGEVLK